MFTFDLQRLEELKRTCKITIVLQIVLPVTQRKENKKEVYTERIIIQKWKLLFTKIKSYKQSHLQQILYCMQQKQPSPLKIL